jgi:endonuclease YncB( thermonuclease family)
MLGRMSLPTYLLHAVLASALAFTASAYAAEGRVVSVQDGDTLTVLDASNTQHRIRIGGIDAPEKRQAFGNAAKENLARLTAGRSVDMRCHKRDRYGREICSVFVGARDVGLEQIRNGYAWWYRDYAREQPPEDRASYATAKTDAKDARRGLWQDTHPTPPWTWRMQMRAKLPS